jgi:hypothetical protein
MSHRPFKKRDWDAELARLGVPSDSPMRLIQRNGNAVGDEANNDIVAASEEDGAAAGTDAGGDIGTPDAASENAGGGGARRGWSPARPFDLGADRSPFLTDVAPSPKDDDDHQPDELRRWKPGATPLAVGGMLGDVYGRDDDGKNDGDDERRNRTGHDGIDDARVPTGTTRWANDAQPIAFLGAVADDPIAATWLRRLRADGFNVAAHVGPPSRADDEDLPRGVLRASQARHAAELALGSPSPASNPKAWAPGVRAKDARDACARNEGAPQPRPLLVARFANESAFAHAMDVLLGGGNNDDATRSLVSGKLVVVNATPTTVATSQRVGARLAALGVPYVHVAIAGGAREIESGDAHAFAAYVDGKVPAHVLRRCGVVAAGRNRSRDVVMDECERALRALTQDAPTVVATDDCAACCDLRLVETTRTIAMRARVRETFRLGARLARSESERSKLVKTADDAVAAANDARRDARLARKDAAGVTGRLEEAERSARDLTRLLRDARAELELERRASAQSAARCAVLERELLAADSAVAGSIPKGAGDDKEEEEDTEDKEDKENRALRQSVEHLNAEMARVRSTTAAKVCALVDAKEKAERDLHAVTKRACAAERAEREAVAASETLRGETNRLDADLVNAQKRLASAEVALVDERRRAAEVAAELESTRRRHESESRRTNAELEFLSENFPDAAGDLANAEAEIERLNDELRALRDELASVNAAREDAARSAAESIEAAKSEAADAVVAADAKEKELWARDRQLEKRARDANAAAKASAERVAALTDEKATLAAELTGAKAAIRRTNRAKDEATRRLRDELEETKKALLHATSRRVGRPWAPSEKPPSEGNGEDGAGAGAPGAANADARADALEDKLEKERGRRDRAEAASSSLQSALASARKQSHADHERAIEERRTLKALASALELERDSLRVTLKGRADLAADLTARARRDAGVVAGFKARCDRAHRELKQEKDAVARLAKRLAESERERGSARARMETATATASRVTREAAAATAEAETARADAAKAAIDATAARHELESATRARDVAMEDAARLKALVGAHEGTIEELRREVRSLATRSPEEETRQRELVERTEALVEKQSEELEELRAKVRDAEEQTRKATAALVKTEAWARAAEKALAAEKASSPNKAKGSPARSVRRAGDGSNIAGSNPASAAASPLRPLDVNAEHRDGSTADEKRLEKRAEKRREEPPSTASSVENLPELLSSHAPSPARPRPAVAAAKVAANVETPREETKRHPCRLARETPRADADVAERRLAEIAAELDDLRPALASLQRALGSIEMKPTLDALRLGKRAPRPCEALAAILALSVTDPRLFDGQAPLTRDDVANALRAGDAFGIEPARDTLSPDQNPEPPCPVHARWIAVRGHLNHHAVTVGDGAHGALATRTRVEPLEARAAAACVCPANDSDTYENGASSRDDLAFAVSQLKALVEGGLGEAEAAASGCAVCELLHAWSVAAVRTRQLIGQRMDAEALVCLEENERFVSDEMDEAEEVERAFVKVRARRGGAKGRAAAWAAKPPRRPSRVRDFVF